MKLAPSKSEDAFKLIELVFTTALVGVVGLIIYSVLNTGLVLGAKNTAVNTAHQQARSVMLQMLQDLHSAVSLPKLVDASGNNWTASTAAPGISFQMWASKTDGSPFPPFKILATAAAGQKLIKISTGAPVQAGQRLILPFYQIEDDIVAYNSGTGFITLANNLPAAVAGPMSGTPTYYSVCYITDRCAYSVVNGSLQWSGPTQTTRNGLAKLGDSITSDKPFNISLSATGTPDFLAMTAIDLSTSDGHYSKRGFRSANILLNDQVPLRARLTTFQ